MTTIQSVRHNGKAAIGGDGQVTLGNTVVKHQALKVRRLQDGKVFVGFAGATADAFALIERFEKTLWFAAKEGQWRQGVALGSGCAER